MPTIKTTDFDRLLDAIQYRLNNFAALVEPLIDIFDIDASHSQPTETKKEAYTKSVDD